MNTDKEVVQTPHSQETTDSPSPIENKPVAKEWPESANTWAIGKTVQVQDIYGKTIKSALVVNYAPNYLVVLKVGGAYTKLTHGLPVKIGDNVFFVAQREPKKKLIGVFYVCKHEAKSAIADQVDTTNVIS